MTQPSEVCILFLCLPGSEWPAWVQAVGSVLAIGAAALFVLLQHCLELRRERSNRLVRQNAIAQQTLAIFDATESVVTRARDSRDEPRSCWTRLTNPGTIMAIQALRHAAMEMPASEVAEVDAFATLLDLRLTLTALEELLNDVSKEHSTTHRDQSTGWDTEYRKTLSSITTRLADGATRIRSTFASGGN
jgi:hypothetical protein